MFLEAMKGLATLKTALGQTPGPPQHLHSPAQALSQTGLSGGRGWCGSIRRLQNNWLTGVVTIVVDHVTIIVRARDRRGNVAISENWLRCMLLLQAFALVFVAAEIVRVLECVEGLVVAVVGGVWNQKKRIEIYAKTGFFYGWLTAR